MRFRVQQRWINDRLRLSFTCEGTSHGWDVPLMMEPYDRIRLLRWVERHRRDDEPPAIDILTELLGHDEVTVPLLEQLLLGGGTGGEDGE